MLFEKFGGEQTNLSVVGVFEVVLDESVSCFFDVLEACSEFSHDMIDSFLSIWDFEVESLHEHDEIIDHVMDLFFGLVRQGFLVASTLVLH